MCFHVPAHLNTEHPAGQIVNDLPEEMISAREGPTAPPEPKPQRRYHRIDGWRGYWIPGTAVAGSSDTGTWSDSPCPTPEVKREIGRFQREVLRPAGIKSRTRYGGSSNLFCGKRWVVVDRAQWPRAKELADKWLTEHDRDTRYIHSAD
jgi:hypothetical protein